MVLRGRVERLRRRVGWWLWRLRHSNEFTGWSKAGPRDPAWDLTKVERLEGAWQLRFGRMSTIVDRDPGDEDDLESRPRLGYAPRRLCQLPEWDRDTGGLTEFERLVGQHMDADGLVKLPRLTQGEQQEP